MASQAWDYNVIGSFLKLGKYPYIRDLMADREGFEPSVSFPTHAFQACAFDHSAICPFKEEMKLYQR